MITRKMFERSLAAMLIFTLVLFVKLYEVRKTVPVTVRVAAASSMGGVMEEIKAISSGLYPDIKLEVVSGSSGNLAAQIINGAPYDIFISADMENPARLYELHLCADKPTASGQGTLILFTTEGLPLSQGVNIFKDPRVKRIALADPKTAPYGKAAIEVLIQSGLYVQLADKIVTAPSVGAVAQYTRSGADVGFTSLSLLQTEAMKQYNVKGKYWVEVDKKLYTPILQGMALLDGAKGSSEAKAVYSFMLSKQGQEIFEKYGLIEPLALAKGGLQ